MPFPSPGNFPKPGIEPRSPVLQADSLPTETKEKQCSDIKAKGDVSTLPTFYNLTLIPKPVLGQPVIFVFPPFIQQILNSFHNEIKHDFYINVKLNLAYNITSTN